MRFYLESSHKNIKGMGTYITVLLLSILVAIPVVILTARVSYQNTKLQLTANAQAANAAKSGVTDALSWFRRQPSLNQPVHCSDPSLYPDSAFNPSFANKDTTDQAIGLVKEYPLSENGLWVRYEVRRAADAISPDPDAARDITDRRIEGGTGG